MHVSAAETADLLREILAGQRELSLCDAKRPWLQIAVGECALMAGDAQLVLYADSATLDHVVGVRMSNGRSGSFVEWLANDGHNPLALLDEDERLELEYRLHGAR